MAMNKSSINQSNISDYDMNFLTGIYCLFGARYKEARHFFLSAVYDNYPLDDHYSVYQSYLGLSGVLLDYKNKTLNHCHHSTGTDIPDEAEAQLNLACAEFIKGDRKRAFQAMNKIDKSDLPPETSKDINSLFNIVGKRRRDNDGILKRNKFVNKFMGKQLRKKEIFDSSDIETFIIKTAKNRYIDIMRNQLH